MFISSEHKFKSFEHKFKSFEYKFKSYELNFSDSFGDYSSFIFHSAIVLCLLSKLMPTLTRRLPSAW